MHVSAKQFYYHFELNVFFTSIIESEFSLFFNCTYMLITLEKQRLWKVVFSLNLAIGVNGSKPFLL